MLDGCSSTDGTSTLCLTALGDELCRLEHVWTLEQSRALGAVALCVVPSAYLATSKRPQSTPLDYTNRINGFAVLPHAKVPNTTRGGGGLQHQPRAVKHAGSGA